MTTPTTPTIVIAWRDHAARTAAVSRARAHLRAERILGPHPCPVPDTVIDLTDPAPDPRLVALFTRPQRIDA